jgi:hypothetical protein
VDEQAWLKCDEAYQLIIYVREKASVRTLRLVAAAYARWLMTLPGYEEARPCADIIEEVADEPKTWDELELRLYALPGWSWALSHTLGSDERVGQELSKMVFGAESSFRERFENPCSAHERMIELLHEVFGNPFRPRTLDQAWLTPTVTAIARTIYDERRFADMPILADALEEAGCTSAEILAHCRSNQEHVRGCWVVDLILDKQ